MRAQNLRQFATLLMLAVAAATGVIRLAGNVQAGGAANAPAANQAGSAKKINLPKSGAPRRVQPGDLLYIIVVGTLPDQPIRGIFQVEDSGKVALGPLYGRVIVEGLTVEEAEPALKESLGKIIQNPALQVTWPISNRGDQARELSRRLDRLENDLQALRAALNELGKKR